MSGLPKVSKRVQKREQLADSRHDVVSTGDHVAMVVARVVFRFADYGCLFFCWKSLVDTDEFVRGMKEGTLHLLCWW